jgi:hypothetical protein
MPNRRPRKVQEDGWVCQGPPSAPGSVRRRSSHDDSRLAGWRIKGVCAGRAPPPHTAFSHRTIPRAASRREGWLLLSEKGARAWADSLRLTARLPAARFTPSFSHLPNPDRVAPPGRFGAEAPPASAASSQRTKDRTRIPTGQPSFDLGPRSAVRRPPGGGAHAELRGWPAARPKPPHRCRQ